MVGHRHAEFRPAGLIQERPGPAVPGPGLGAVRRRIDAAEHHLLEGVVIVDGAVRPRAGAGGRMALGPGHAVPGPGVGERLADALGSRGPATEEDHDPVNRVVGHHPAPARGRALSGVPLVPGAVPGPRVGEGGRTPVRRSAEEDHRLSRSVVGELEAGAGRRRDRRGQARVGRHGQAGGRRRAGDARRAGGRRGAGDRCHRMAPGLDQGECHDRHHQDRCHRGGDRQPRRLPNRARDRSRRPLPEVRIFRESPQPSLEGNAQLALQISHLLPPR